MTLTITISTVLEEKLRQEATRQGLSAAEYAQQLLEAGLNQPSRNLEAVELLQSWIEEEDPTDQVEVGDYLIKALDRDRLSDRPLYPPELEGKSW